MSSMETELTNLPKSALSFYVTLFCKRKGETEPVHYNANLTEATKSWVSLTEEEKHQFALILEECRQKYKIRFADYLRNAKPYLRKKYNNRLRTQQLHNNHNYEQSYKEKSNSVYDVAENLGLYDSNIHSEPEEPCSNHFKEYGSPALVSNVEESTNVPMPEPVPPCVKTAEELFKIIKAKDENLSKNWHDLTQREKIRYRTAVLTLKKDYIKKYKAYLKSLSSIKLFEYYNMKIVS